MTNMSIQERGKNLIQEKTEYIEQNISVYIDRHILKTRKIFRVGPGDFDLIGINRVRNIHSCPRTTIVMCPGANSNFDTSFNEMAIYLARLGIDVWGIDFRYSFVPDNFNSDPYCLAADCSFMKNWNTDMHVSDIDTIVKMAELSSRTGKVFLIGYSQGAYYTYKYSVINPNLNGIIPMDITYNVDPIHTDLIDKTRAEADRVKAVIDSGIYYEDIIMYKYVAYQAYNNPDGPSDIIPELTNKQAFLFMLTTTYQLPIFLYTPYFRYAQGDITGLKYTDYDHLIQKIFSLNNFQSIITSYEQYLLWLSDQIPNITVPILYIGAEFGFGTYGSYTPNKIHEFNPNVNTHIVPDYGHADITWSSTANIDVWNRIHRWLMANV